MSLTTQKQTLYARLCSDTDAGKPVAALTQVTQVFDHEPVTPVQGVRVTIQTAGWDAVHWFFAIKVYVDLTQGAKDLQAKQDTTIGELEALLDPYADTVKSDGVVKYEAELTALVATFNVKMPRDDYP